MSGTKDELFAAKVGGLAEVSIRVSDLEKSVEFYTRVLGLEDVTPDDEGQMENGPRLLRVSKTETGYSQAVNLFRGKGVSGSDSGALHHLAFQVPRESFEENQKRFEELGFEPLRNDHPEVPVRSMYIKDPDGYWIEVFSEAANPEDAPARDDRAP